MDRHVTFLCGRGGVYALGAVAANYRGDHQRRDLFLSLFLEVSTNLQPSSLTNKVIDVLKIFFPHHMAFHILVYQELQILENICLGPLMIHCHVFFYSTAKHSVYYHNYQD